MTSKNLTRSVFIFVFVLLIPALVFVGPQRTFACSCARGPVGAVPTRSGLLDSADAIFTGTARDVEYVDDETVSEPRIIVTFDVSEVWKGPDQKNIVLHTVYNTYTCNGYFFKEGEEYLVYATRQVDGTLGTGLCSGTTELGRSASASQDISVLGMGTVPTTPGESGRVPVQEPISSSFRIIVGLSVIAIILARVGYTLTKPRRSGK